MTQLPIVYLVTLALFSLLVLGQSAVLGF